MLLGLLVSDATLYQLPFSISFAVNMHLMDTSQSSTTSFFFCSFLSFAKLLIYSLSLVLEQHNNKQTKNN